MSGYILAIDASSSSCKAALVDDHGRVVREHSLPVGTQYLSDFHVEQDPEEIFKSQVRVMKEVLVGIDPILVKGIGISNQRETVVAWDPETGLPLYPAISWQDRRNLDFFQDLKPHEDFIRKTTGLVFHPYFSASKVKWLLSHLQGQHFKIGTIDSWLIFKLTGHQVFATDVSNASRTMLMDIEKLCWSEELLELFQISEDILPQIKNSLDDYGSWEYRGVKIPILGVLGDQQAALFSLGTEEGTACCTYGTGAFLLVNCGIERKTIPNTLTTVSWKLDEGETSYAIESSLFSCGNAMKQFEKKGSIGNYEMSTQTYLDSFLLPAFNGNLFLMDSKEYQDLSHNEDAVLGDPENLLKSLCNGIALAVDHMLSLFREDIDIKELWVNGRVSDLEYLNSVQSSICGLNVMKCSQENQSIMGIAYLVGIGVNFWELKDLQNMRAFRRVWLPQEINPIIKDLKRSWKKAL
ncbi:glycerol kinase [Mycoplasma haemofelis str. Langford 1]|uniref:Glycerol kinase n=1 Tax=Mycoplasma haemofelis (strain Langford 1) TaxID=941640 RepID=E8ZK38_MYCHL|nr:FGGY family carbohydrate kinase [Mycoplasma haemofelis]CBY93509.1 glycerol kinase [Mycoplasma haemofelis str. Langford 1]